jgi:TM2 domain-containing membrane protein YozV
LAPNPSQNPRNAALAAWILPGAGHVYAGFPGRGVVVFVVVMGLFALGYLMVDVRLFGFTAPMEFLSVLSWVPYYLLPEFGNFAGSVAAQLLLGDRTIDVVRLARVPRELEHVGLTLTACSGVLNLLFASEAWWLAGRGARARPAPLDPAPLNPGRAALVSWLVPGAGHWLLGQRSKGLLLLGSIVFLFVLGLVFSGFTGTDRAQLYWWWAGQIFFGGGTVAATMALGPLHVTETKTFVDLGITLLTVAGLMNLIVIVDAYSLAEARARPA